MSGYIPPRMYPCCPHCVTDGLDCRPTDPGHAMACKAEGCGQ